MIRAISCALALLCIVWFEPTPADACGVKLSIGAPGAKRRLISARQTLSAKRTSDVRKPVRTGPALRLRDTVGAGGGNTVASGPATEPEPPPPEPKPKKQRKPPTPAPEPKTTDTTDAEPKPAVSDTTGETKPDRPAETAPRPGGKGRLWNRGFFGNASANLNPRLKARLAETAKWLASNPDKSITIEGHTSSVGSATLNQQLSERRAESVKDFLVEQGVDASRITTRGVGSDKPAFSPGNNPKNRRVEITVD